MYGLGYLGLGQPEEFLFWAVGQAMVNFDASSLQGFRV